MTRIIGHKGAAALAPENRAEAFTLAGKIGADGVELDVRRGPDNRLVVWHDPTLPSGLSLRTSPWTDLRDDVDELTTVLDTSAGLDPVNVEIKNNPAEDDFDADYTITADVADLLAARPRHEQDALIVSCFDLDTLNAARRHLDQVAPHIATGWLVLVVIDVDQAITLTVDNGHQALHPHHSSVTPELITAAHAQGITVNCWTCNDPDRIRWLAEIGTDGIITDNPTATLEALGR